MPRPPSTYYNFFPYKAILGIAAVRDAVRRYPPNDQTLTAIHSDLIQVR